MAGQTAQVGREMRNDWPKAISFVLEHEGGLTNDPDDPGGITKYGISKKSYPNVDIFNLTREGAEEIYRRDYWNKCRCDDLPPECAIATFDCAVNQGPETAIYLLQKALGVKQDGIIGRITLKAAESATPRMLRVLLAERLASYARLMAAKPKLLVFATNWSFRVLSLARLLGV